MKNELPELKLTNIHEALAEAAGASKKTEHMKSFSVRLPESVKATAQRICERHATDLGTYLRECAKALCADYGHDLPEDQA